MKTFTFRCSLCKLSSFQILLERAFSSNTPCELLVICQRLAFRDCNARSSVIVEGSEILSLSDPTTSFSHVSRREPISTEPSRYFTNPWSFPVLVDFPTTTGQKIDSDKSLTMVFHISTIVLHVSRAIVEQKFCLGDAWDRLQPCSVDISITCDWSKQPFFNLLPAVDFAQAEWLTLPETGQQVKICKRTAMQIFKFVDYLTRLDAKRDLETKGKSSDCPTRNKPFGHQMLHVDIPFEYLDYVLQYLNELVTIEQFYHSPSTTRAICVFRTSSRPKLVLELAPRYVSTKAGFEFDLVTGFTNVSPRLQEPVLSNSCNGTKDPLSFTLGTSDVYPELQEDFRLWKTSKSLDPAKLFRLCQPFDRFEWTLGLSK